MCWCNGNGGTFQPLGWRFESPRTNIHVVPKRAVHPLMDYVLLIKHDFVLVVAFGQAKDKTNTKVVSNNGKKKSKKTW